jgi:hypothetical protein
MEIGDHHPNHGIIWDNWDKLFFSPENITIG